MNSATLEFEKRILNQIGIPLVEREASLRVRPLETYSQRIWRHLKSLDINPKTINRGIKQLGNKRMTISADAYGDFINQKIETDYLGITGLTKAKYDYSDGIFVRTAAYLYDFPKESKFQVCATSPDQRPVSSENFFMQAIENSPAVIAYFTGPTYVPTYKLPNNGFHLKEYPRSIEFQDTFPSGERRGAFATSEKGGLVIMSDAAKWKLVRGGFPGIKSLVGGGSYFTDQDTLLNGYSGNSSLSYLFQYRNIDTAEEVHTGFVSIGGFGNRLGMQRLLTDYVSRVGGGSFIALEMEYYNATCFFKGETDFRGGFDNRFDHYLVSI